VHSSGCASHCIVLDVIGNAWMFGRNIPPAMGSPSNSFDEISEFAPRCISPTQLGAPTGTKFVHAACGRQHSILVGSNGDMWSAGGNASGQCGHNPSKEVTSFNLIKGPTLGGKKQKVIQVGAGITFSLCLTEDGKVWAFGSAEAGQLGNGRTGEHIATGNKLVYDLHHDPTLVRGIEDVKIVSLACGNSHSILLDDKGFVYTFGYNGLCRLGLGDQQNRLKATVVPQFANLERSILLGKKVFAGPSCSVVINGQDMFWLAGKYKNTGDGSGGQPWTTFKHVPEIMSCTVHHAALGGVTLWALSQNEDGTPLTIGWGQSAANGELGLGPDEVKSATKPVEIQPLKGIEILDVAGGQNTTYFIAKPSDKTSDLPRHPDEVEHADGCVVCRKDEEGADNPPLICEKCDNPYHIKCLDPPLSAVPEGEWFCESCATEIGAPSFGTVHEEKKFISDTIKGKGNTKRKASDAGVKSSAKKKK